MEYNYFGPHDQEEEDGEDVLSLCNLPINGEEPESNEFSDENHNLSFDQNLFEFFSTSTKGPGSDHSEMNKEKQIVFCGKIIASEPEDRRRRLISEPFAPARSNSFRFPISNPSPSRLKSCRYSSTSARSRKHHFMFVLEKFRPDMELSDIKKRQSRRPPAPMFPPVDGGKRRSQHWDCFGW